MSPPRGPLPEDEYRQIYSRVPRLTVEIVIAHEHAVLLTLRRSGPCRGLWHLPGGTVRFGERLTEAVERVARDELGVAATAGGLLGYIEYPSHYEHGLDCPVGVAFRTVLTGEQPAISPTCRWFEHLPVDMHEEQREFLCAQGLARA